MQNKLSLLALGLIMACNSSQTTVTESQENKPIADPAKTYAATITESELREHLFTYASDDFEGRETGKEGQKKAVNYLKEQYQQMQIPAAQADGNYFQEVPLEITKLPEGSVSSGAQTYTMGKDFITFSSAEINADQLVYAGYGIEDTNYSDFESLDVAGKVVLIKAGEPMAEDKTYRVSGTMQPSEWGKMSEGLAKKSEVLTAKGAKAILFYDPQNYSRFKRSFDYMSRNNSGRMGLKQEDENAALIVISKDMATSLYPEISENNKAKVLDTPVTINLKSENEQISSENVVAFIKGSEKPGEYIVISSHLDHIGVNDDGKINNGADDDGSGTVAMLEIAEAFKAAAKAGNGPKRSLVFLHVTGEEKGLLGSQYYTDFDPIFPLANTVANLNIDMIGRIDPKRDGDRNYIYLIGSDKLSTDLHQLSEAVNDKYSQMELDYIYNDENDPNRFYYRSDHYNFAKNNIPIIFYFNGTHADYHRHTDTPDKINYDLLKNRAQLVFYTAWELANREQRITVDKAAK
ncbi:M28 family peptidase [Zeaxanthinibacter enoshimensis]|uniref:M28 family peptidase n=1 Tax=Zeaxanthinibacter enoshimensis TaxID=392009 RepID=UPI003568742A